jgi:translocation and assembly module TamA
LLLAVHSPAVLAANRIELNGLSGVYEDNVKVYLSVFDAKQINSSARFKNRVLREIRQALRAQGHYQVEVDFADKKDGNDYVLVANVTPNKFVYIDLLDLQLNGEAVRDNEFTALQRKMAPRKGQRLDHGRYENYKQALLNLSHRKGYFDARFTRGEMVVTPGKRAGKMYLHFDSGPRYRFGDITFSGAQIRTARLRSLLPFKEGDYYSAEQLAKLNQALANTLWFGSVDLNADPDLRQDGRLPLEVALTPATRNTVEAGLGYASDVGARIKASWFKPWLNDRGHSLSADLSLSQRDQLLESSYKFPLRDVANDYYQLIFGFRNQEILSADSREYNLKGERRWLLDNGWYRTASVRWLHSESRTYSENQNTVLRQNSNLVLPGISFDRKSDTGGSMPLGADLYLLNIEAANQAWGADSDFIRLSGRAGWIGAFSPDQRWLVRLDAGTILQESAEQIPLSLRFYAGGDNSLRGYGYQTIPPRDANNEFPGGTRLVTSSFEYQHRMKGDWWLALFSDYGSAWTEKPDWKQSVGLGVRWASPVGPIRLDLAYGLDHDPHGRFRLHFTLGPEL